MQILLPDASAATAGPSACFDLLACERHFYLINKYPGVSFHRQAGEPGLIERVRAQLGPIWPVHRLDRMTSGLLLLARSAEAARLLSLAFAEHRIDKRYLALSDRKPAKKQGLITGDMLKGRGGAWRLISTQQHPARTRFISRSVAPGLRLFWLKPLTGRTHQLRVAMKSLGAPIIGDPLYHAAVTPAPDRGYLHACSLRFELEGERYHFVLPPRVGELFLSPAVQQALAAETWPPAALDRG